MKRLVKYLVTLFLFLGCILIYSNCQAQKNTGNSTRKSNSKITKASDDVEIVCYGEGTTPDEATKKALRSGIEQTYGVFVSSNTNILNDEIIKDEISTIASGNIKKYDIVSQAQINDKWCITVKALISTSHLVSYVQSHGGSAELAGATFAMNVKMEQLNEKAERKVLVNLGKQLNAISKCMYDYTIQVQDPKKTSSCWYNYSVWVRVCCRVNHNVSNFYSLFMNTIKSLDLTTEAATNRLKMGLDIFPFFIGEKCDTYAYRSNSIPNGCGYDRINTGDELYYIKARLLNPSLYQELLRYPRNPVSKALAIYTFRTSDVYYYFNRYDNMTNCYIDDGAGQIITVDINTIARERRHFYILERQLLVTPIAPGTEVGYFDIELKYSNLEDVAKIKKITVKSRSCE